MKKDVLGVVAEGLKAYEREAIRIVARPLGDGEELGLKESKFGGLPYLPVGMEYPKDADGRPMRLWVQINFGEVPALEDFPGSGMLQVFSSEDWGDSEDILVLFHEVVEDACLCDFPYMAQPKKGSVCPFRRGGDPYEFSPMACEHRLSFERVVEYGSFTDFRCSAEVGGIDLDEYVAGLEGVDEGLLEEVEELLLGGGHKLGGYASFAQDDPRGEEPARHGNGVQLLQIDSDDRIMFGDSGVAHIFIDRDRLRARDFGAAWGYWDCR